MREGLQSYVYGYIASSWGVKIEIVGTAELARKEDAKCSGDDVVNLLFSGGAESLEEAHKSKLRDGLIVNADRLRKSLNNRRVTINVREVSFVETDFQTDALPVAMCRWVEHVFELPSREIYESFDAVANRYHFELR